MPEFEPNKLLTNLSKSDQSSMQMISNARFDNLNHVKILDSNGDVTIKSHRDLLLSNFSPKGNIGINLITNSNSMYCKMLPANATLKQANLLSQKRYFYVNKEQEDRLFNQFDKKQILKGPEKFQEARTRNLKVQSTGQLRNHKISAGQNSYYKHNAAVVSSLQKFQKKSHFQLSQRKVEDVPHKVQNALNASKSTDCKKGLFSKISSQFRDAINNSRPFSKQQLKVDSSQPRSRDLASVGQRHDDSFLQGLRQIQIPSESINVEKSCNLDVLESKHLLSVLLS